MYLYINIKRAFFYSKLINYRKSQQTPPLSSCNYILHSFHAASDYNYLIDPPLGGDMCADIFFVSHPLSLSSYTPPLPGS